MVWWLWCGHWLSPGKLLSHWAMRLICVLRCPLWMLGGEKRRADESWSWEPPEDASVAESGRDQETPVSRIPEEESSGLGGGWGVGTLAGPWGLPKSLAHSRSLSRTGSPGSLGDGGPSRPSANPPTTWFLIIQCSHCCQAFGATLIPFGF